MLKIVHTNKYNKHLKICEKRQYDIFKLLYVVKQLSEKKVLDRKYKDHKLKGQSEEIRECHIENDWLLIYRKTDTHLFLMDTGTHSDMFE